MFEGSTKPPRAMFGTQRMLEDCASPEIAHCLLWLWRGAWNVPLSLFKLFKTKRNLAVQRARAAYDLTSISSYATMTPWSGSSTVKANPSLQPTTFPSLREQMRKGSKNSSLASRARSRASIISLL